MTAVFGPFLALVAREWPFALAGSIGFVGLIAGAWVHARAARKRLESLAFDDRGIRWTESGVEHLVRWEAVTGVHYYGPLRIEAETPVCVRLSLLRDRSAILGLIKVRAAHAYTLDAISEQWVLAGDTRQTPSGAGPVVPLVADAPAAYRVSAHAKATTIRDPLPISSSERWLIAVTVAILVLSSVVFLASLDWRSPLGTVLGCSLYLIAALCVLILAAVAESRITAWRWRRRVHEYVGEGARASVRQIVSADGSRRVRATVSDLFDPFAGAHAHFEVLDPLRGTTLSSSVVMYAFSFPARELARNEVRAAIIDARSFSPRCRDEKDRPFGLPRVLLLQDTADGALLTRFTLDRQYAGDTLHENAAQAERQIADELGVTSIAWYVLEPKTPWSFWPELERAAAADLREAAADLPTSCQ